MPDLWGPVPLLETWEMGVLIQITVEAEVEDMEDLQALEAALNSRLDFWAIDHEMWIAYRGNAKPEE